MRPLGRRMDEGEGWWAAAEQLDIRRGLRSPTHPSLSSTILATWAVRFSKLRYDASVRRSPLIRGLLLGREPRWGSQMLLCSILPDRLPSPIQFHHPSPIQFSSSSTFLQQHWAVSVSRILAFHLSAVAHQQKVEWELHGMAVLTVVYLQGGVVIAANELHARPFRWR